MEVFGAPNNLYTHLEWPIILDSLDKSHMCNIKIYKECTCLILLVATSLNAMFALKSPIKTSRNLKWQETPVRSSRLLVQVSSPNPPSESQESLKIGWFAHKIRWDQSFTPWKINGWNPKSWRFFRR